MEWLSLSSVSRGSAGAFAGAVCSRPKFFRIDGSRGPMRYWVDGPLAVGSKVHYGILVGLRSMSWDAEVVRVSEGSFETCLVDAKSSQLAAFRGTHAWRDFGEGKVLVRDEIEFDAPGRVKGDVRTAWTGSSGEAAASDESKTGEMSLVDAGIA